MKKILRSLALIVLMIASVVFFILAFYNIVIVVRILFFGMEVGSMGYPDSLFLEAKTLQGLDGLNTYYKSIGEMGYLFELPIILVCILYQALYYKVLDKKLK